MSGRERGLSLVEAMAAGAVVASGMLALGALSAGLIRGNRHAELLLAALRAAEDRTESLLAAVPLDRAGQLAPGEHPPDSAGAPRYEGLDRLGNVVVSPVAAGDPGVALLRRWTVFEEARSPCLRRVRIRVFDPSGSTPLVSLETLIPCAAGE